MSVKLDHGDDELAENREINVTPFIDVILVLLIALMLMMLPRARRRATLMLVMFLPSLLAALAARRCVHS